MTGNLATQDAHVLQILANAGAIFHARTTQPQTIMHLETSSNSYGTTTCPYNSELSAGGSSGGEGSLGSLRGSILGVGSDVGGRVLHGHQRDLSDFQQAEFALQRLIRVSMGCIIDLPHSY